MISTMLFDSIGVLYGPSPDRNNSALSLKIRSLPGNLRQGGKPVQELEKKYRECPIFMVFAAIYSMFFFTGDHFFNANGKVPAGNLSSSIRVVKPEWAKMGFLK